MAIYNEILSGRYAKFLQRTFSMKGEVPAKQLAGEVMPVIPFQSGNENRWLEGWLLYSKSVIVPAVAAQQGFLQLRNPLGSGVIAVIHKLCVSEAAIDIIFASETNAAQADGTIQSVFGLDSRNTGNSTLIFSFSSSAADPRFGNGIIWGANIAANVLTDYVLDSVQEIPMLAGLTLRVSSNTQNVAFLVTVGWRERPIEDSERL